MDHYYAHSGVSKKGILPQPYEAHILNMYHEVQSRMGILPPILQKAVLLGTLYHDEGKLIPSSQDLLCQLDRQEGAHLVNHVDAGVAWSLQKYKSTQDMAWLYAAYLIHAHHIGLQNKAELYTERVVMLEREVLVKPKFRDFKYDKDLLEPVATFFDGVLDSLNTIQLALFGAQISLAESMRYASDLCRPCDLRFALSILVEADHGDTARHQGEPFTQVYELKASERLSKLQEVVALTRDTALASGISREVVDSRSQLFDLCSAVDLSQHQFFVCAAPTGKGKTFSLMNLALRIATEKSRERVFFIIPYTNLISQTVKTYRKLALSRENPKHIVNEIHSKVEYSSYYNRIYSHKWNSPINVSTSLQFFESLFSNHPATVRKLHNLANSVVVFDEFHNALPHHLWKISLLLLKEISIKYNIDFVFGSGTHVYYWDIFNSKGVEVLNVVPDSIFDEFSKFEKDRIVFRDLGLLASDEILYERFHAIATKDGNLIGNTIMVMNTVMNAISVTKWFKTTHPDWAVFHMSSCLTPCDRETILEDIHKQLKAAQPILLIATSVVECGIDFSFDLGFREKGSLLSAIQFGGRINRNKEIHQGIVYEFKLSTAFIKDTPEFTCNFSFNPCIAAREGIEVHPDNCTDVISREISMGNKQDLVALENTYAFDDLNSQFQVISTPTISVLINTELTAKVLAGEFVSPVEINRNSVSVYEQKLDPTKENNFSDYIFNQDDMYFWHGPYDPNVYGVYAYLVGMTSPCLLC